MAGIFLEGGFLRSILEHPGDLAGYGRRRLGSGLEDEETVWRLPTATGSVMVVRVAATAPTPPPPDCPWEED